MRTKERKQEEITEIYEERTTEAERETTKGRERERESQVNLNRWRTKRAGTQQRKTEACKASESRSIDRKSEAERKREAKDERQKDFSGEGFRGRYKDKT